MDIRIQNVRKQFDRFPALRLAREALEEGGSSPAVLNAANEVAVARFLAGSIRFTDISDLAARALEANRRPAPKSLEEVLEVDREVRAGVAMLIEERCA